MLTKKLLYTVNHPKTMLDAGLHRLHSLFGQQSYRKFIVLTQGRSGSNLLLSMLNSHPNIYTKNEIFQRLNGRSAESVLAKIYRTHPKQVQAVGFKIFYRHPFDEASTQVWDLLTAIEELHVIHLKRRNLLRLAVSKKIAHQTDSWVNRNGTGATIASHEKQVHFTVDELITEFTETDELQRRFGQLFDQKPMISCYYEDLVANPNAGMAQMTNFLALAPCAPKVSVKRQNPESLSSLLMNYHELKAAFAGTAWISFFEE